MRVMCINRVAILQLLSIFSRDDMAEPSLSRVRRLTYLDSLRGIAALSVVFYHYTYALQDKGSLSGLSLKFSHIIIYYIDLGKFGVVLFFLISGYIIPTSLKDARGTVRDFAVTRFCRLYPFYWFMLLIYILFSVGDRASELHLVKVISNATMVQGFLGQSDIMGPAWTLQIELVFYVMCGVLAAMTLHRSPYTMATSSLALVLIALLFAVIRFMLHKKVPVVLPLGLSVMFLGALWRQLTLEGSPVAKRLFSLIFIPFCFLLLLTILVAYHDDNPLAYLTCYFSALMIFLISTGSHYPRDRLFSFLGTISYSLYLIHPILPYFALKSQTMTDLANSSPLSFEVLLVTASVLLSWLSYRLLEKPSIRLGHNIVRDLRSKPMKLQRMEK